MEQTIWAKTILKVYRFLDKAIYLIDDAVNKISLMPELTADEVTDKLINLSQRKVSLINLRIIVEDILATCQKKHIRVLGLKYFQALKMDEIAKIMNLSERSVYRLYADAIEEFSAELLRLHFDKNWFYKFLKTERWILLQYAKEYQKFKIEDSGEKIKKYIIDEPVQSVILINQFRKSLF